MIGFLSSWIMVVRGRPTSLHEMMFGKGTIVKSHSHRVLLLFNLAFLCKSNLKKYTVLSFTNAILVSKESFGRLVN